MITVTIPGGEYFDQDTSSFIAIRPKTVTMEHSLLSISKWESKWHKPFFADNIQKFKKTQREIYDYFRCMSITPNMTAEDFAGLPQAELIRVQEYMNDPMTATWFNDRRKRPPSKKIITAEVIYSQMAEFGIPFDICEKWHINRLMTLLRVCGERNVTPEKKKKSDIAKEYAALNKARRGSTGSR